MSTTAAEPAPKEKPAPKPPLTADGNRALQPVPRIAPPPSAGDAPPLPCPDGIADTPLASVPGLPGHVVTKLARAVEVATVGQLWDWVAEDGAGDGGMQDPHGVGVFGRLRSIAVGGRPACRAGEALYAWLKSVGCDPRVELERYGQRKEAIREEQAAECQSNPAGHRPAHAGGAAAGPTPGGSDTNDAMGRGPSVGAGQSESGSDGAAEGVGSRGEGPAPLTDAADFTGDEPPPRRRPVGEPVPRHLKLPPGVSAVAEFLGYDRAGRVPPGSVLCAFVGTDLGRRSGYVVAANPPGAEPLGPIGRHIPLAEIGPWGNRASLVQGAKTWVVATPPGAGRG